MRHLAAAAAWGLNPERNATYFNYTGEHDGNRCYSATYKVPENKAFWSITVYGADGYMKSENNILNSSNVKLHADQTFTVFFGSKNLCGDVPNRLDVTPGWNFVSLSAGTERPRRELCPAGGVSEHVGADKSALDGAIMVAFPEGRRR